MGEVDLDVTDPGIVGREAREGSAHLRAACAEVRTELHEGDPRREAGEIRVGGVEVTAVGPSEPTVASPEHHGDRHGREGQSGDEGERGGRWHRPRLGPRPRGIPVVSSHDDATSSRRRRPIRRGATAGILAGMSDAVPTPYEDLLRDVLENGTHKSDRTGTGTTSVFGRQIRFDLSRGFPLITTKRVHFKSIAYELLWFLRGESNVRWLQDNGVTIWDEWADEAGELGPVYGVQWRSWPAPGGRVIDQLAEVIEQIRRSPDSRRLIVSAWNPADIPDMALAPCHALFQFYVADGRLSCQLYQRSADMFLGVPFNIASYALLTMMIAQQVGLEPGDFVWTGGDTHIYDNHREQVAEQLTRDPYPYPTLRFARKPDSVFDYRYEDFVVEDYQHHAPIRAAVAV